MAKNIKLSEEMEANIKNYASQIKTLESFIEAVRLRPGMYVSGIGNKGFMHLIKEVFQNSVDELQREDSPCDHIWVTYDERNHLVEVTDNGRGLPFGEIVRICTNSHTSSNYNKKEGDFTAGTNGVGVKCVNALSSKFVVESYVLGKAKRVEFSDGIPWDKLEMDIPNEGRQGTYIAFTPAYDVMGTITTSVKEVYDLIYALVPLMKIGAVVDFVGTDKNGVQKIERFVNEDGIIQHLIMKTTNPLIKPVMMFAECGTMKAEIAFTYDANDMSVESISSFSNFCITIGGTHVDGFLEGLCNYFRNYMNRIYLANNNKLSIINNDIKTGLKAVVSVHCLTPIFSGQAKEILNNEEMKGFAKDLATKSLEEFAKTNSSDLQKLCKYFKDIAEIRVKSDESKVKLKDKYSASILSGMPKKYAKPSGNKNLELFICEGDSALGSIKNSRDVTFQGVFPIRGKLPNAFATVKSKFLANEEIASIITIIGGGYGKNFDISKVKWDKIIFATDADSDGYHITSLLLRFFLMYMPEMIQAGRVYKSVPPLYSIKGSKNSKIYFTDRLDFVTYNQKSFSKDNTLYSCDKKKLTSNEVSDLLFRNIDLVYELEVVSNTYAINPYLLEMILINIDKPFKDFKKVIEKAYRFLKVETENGFTVIKGLLDSKYQNVIINDRMMHDLRKVSDLLKSNYSNYYILNDKYASLYEIMKTFERYTPSSLTRYKGLGEMNGKDLFESTLDAENRTLIRYTIEDVKKEIETIQYLENNKSDLLKDIKVSRMDIIE